MLPNQTILPIKTSKADLPKRAWMSRHSISKNTMDTHSITTPPKRELASGLSDHLNAMMENYFSDKAPEIWPTDLRDWLNRTIAQKLKPSRVGIEGSKENQLPAPTRIYFLPPHQDWLKLSLDITRLAKEMGIVRTDFGHLTSCAKRIQHDYPKFRFSTFLEAVEKRLNQFPVPPLTRLDHIHRGLNETGEKTICYELHLILGGKSSSIDGKLYDILPEHVHDLQRYEGLLRRLCPKSHEHLATTASNASLLFILDSLLSEQSRWNELYADDLKNSAPTLYAFQEEKIDHALRRILHGRALTPIELTKINQRSLAASRQRNHRAKKASKLVTNPPKNVTASSNL